MARFYQLPGSRDHAWSLLASGANTASPGPVDCRDPWPYSRTISLDPIISLPPYPRQLLGGIAGVDLLFLHSCHHITSGFVLPTSGFPL